MIKAPWAWITAYDLWKITGQSDCFYMNYKEEKQDYFQSALVQIDIAKY